MLEFERGKEKISTTPEKYASYFTGQEQKLGKLAVFVQARLKEA